MNGLGENPNKTRKSDPSISAANMDGAKLLRLARTAIECYLLVGELPAKSYPDVEAPTCNGLFVTLWSCGTVYGASTPVDELTLRGCIGHLQSKTPLEAFVQEIAVAAATRDPRFPPVSSSELGSIRIEIAVLSPLREIKSLEEIRIGQDGLLIEGLHRRGLLLPKVATRLGWDQESFLAGVCQKAGLPLDVWPDLCKLYAFTTAVFEEDDHDNPL